jgi:large subunit ribosomal protein L22
VRLVAQTLRDLPVSEALVACSFMPRAAARDVAKVIRSAQANAENNFNLVKDDLVVKEIRVEPGPMLKRGQPRAMGRLFSIFKRTSHITAIVEDRPGVVRRRAAALPRAPQPRPTERDKPIGAAASAAARAAAAEPATTESDEREAPKPRRDQVRVTKREHEASTATEVGKKSQAKEGAKKAEAKTTDARAEGKKDQKRDSKEKKGK